jgi:hypothetical protein
LDGVLARHKPHHLVIPSSRHRADVDLDLDEFRRAFPPPLRVSYLIADGPAKETVQPVAKKQHSNGFGASTVWSGAALLPFDAGRSLIASGQMRVRCHWEVQGP